MSEAESGEAAAFRAEVHAWLADNFPAELRGADPIPYMNSRHVAENDPHFERWRIAMADKRWGVPT